MGSIPWKRWGTEASNLTVPFSRALAIEASSIGPADGLLVCGVEHALCSVEDGPTGFWKTVAPVARPRHQCRAKNRRIQR